MKFEGYQSPEEELREKDPDKSYLERTTANGIKVKVGWDRGWNGYVIYFPQIDIVEVGLKREVHDQLLEIGTNPEVVKQVFDYAVKFAETEPDVYKLFQQVEDFIRKLPSDSKR